MDKLKDIKSKYHALPEDAQLYVDMIGYNRENMERALRAHSLIPAPAPDRVPCSGDPEENDEYITAFVHTYCILERMDDAKLTTVN